jgi:serpin B
MNPVSLGLLLTLLSTSATGQGPAETDRVGQPDKDRVSGVELAAVVDGQNRFAWEAYARLRERPGNIGFSPFSLASGLAMVQAGTNGETAEQIAKVLHLPADSASAHRALGLLHRGVLSADAGPRGVKLTSANSLWTAKDLGVLPEYLTLIQEQFQSTVNEAPFTNDPESARRAINAWVKSQTDGNIPAFLKSGAINKTTQLVLANALTFQGTWAAAFKKDRTQPGPFRVSATRQTQVPLMQQTGKFRLADTASGRALELPYTGGDVALVLLLPRQPDGLAELEKRLTGPALAEWLRQLKPETVTVSIPRFTITAESQLKDLLALLGMPLAFQRDGADFSGLCSTEQPFALSSVTQHVRIMVDESGTEAHAATAIRAGRGLGTHATHEFKADRPFVFFLRDLRTGSILFLGRLADPGTPARDER